MIDSLVGGWQTLFPNGGDSVSMHGVEWGYDGEARITWLDWEFTGSSIRMTGRLIRAPFEITKIISMRGSEVTVGETVRNMAKEPIETVWGSPQGVVQSNPAASARRVKDMIVPPRPGMISAVRSSVESWRTVQPRTRRSAS